jgi:hypothetical protein
MEVGKPNHEFLEPSGLRFSADVKPLLAATRRRSDGRVPTNT